MTKAREEAPSLLIPSSIFHYIYQSLNLTILQKPLQETASIYVLQPVPQSHPKPGPRMPWIWSDGLPWSWMNPGWMPSNACLTDLKLRFYVGAMYVLRRGTRWPLQPPSTSVRPGLLNPLQAVCTSLQRALGASGQTPTSQSDMRLSDSVRRF